MKPPERGEAPQVSEIVGQTTISSRSGSPHAAEGIPPTEKSKPVVSGQTSASSVEPSSVVSGPKRKRPVKMGEAAEEVRFDLQKVYLILRGVAETLPFQSDVSRGDLARFAAAVDFIGEFTKRIESTPPALTAFDRVHGEGAGDRFGGTLAGFDPGDSIPIPIEI